jgi:hypothetical protein
MERLAFAEKEGAFEVLAQVDRVGDDLLVLLTGGRAHVGAVAVAQPRPSLADPGQPSSTGSVITLLGHKEDAVAKGMAEALSGKLGRNVVVVAGIHWDALSREGITAVMELCRKIGERIAAAVPFKENANVKA